MWGAAAYPGHVNWYDTNLYATKDTLVNGEPGFSGHSQGWIQTNFSWYMIPVKNILPDTMILRFNFISDSNDTDKEGWMIDDIKLYTLVLPGSIDENPAKNISIYPVPATDHLHINSEDQIIQHAEILNMNGQCILNKEVHHNSASLDVSGISRGAYLIRLYTKDGFFSRKIVIR